MTGIEALKVLRDGLKVKRKHWDEGQFLLFQDPNIIFEANGKLDWPFSGLYHDILLGFLKDDDWELVETGITGVEALQAMKKGFMVKRIPWTEEDGSCYAINAWSGWHIIYTNYKTEQRTKVVRSETELIVYQEGFMLYDDFLHDDWKII
jgi:hypothetical protein